MAASLRKELDSAGLPGIDTKGAERLFGKMPDGSMQPLDGAWVDDVVWVALNAERGGLSTDLSAKIVFGNTDDITTNDVLFLRQLRYTTADWLDSDRYYRFRGEVREAVDAMEAGAEAREPVSDETRRLAGLQGRLKIAEKRLSADRKEITSLNVNTRISETRRRSAKNLVYKRQLKAMLVFNKAFVRSMGPQGE